jgi:hypothetical protein
LLFALLWLGIRWWYSASFVGYDVEKARMVGVFLNLFFILLLVSLGIFVFYKKNEDQSSLGRFKHLVRYPLAYSLFVTISMFFYYSYFTTELPMKRERDIQKQELLLADEVAMKKLREENVNLAEMTTEQIREQGINKINSMTSPKVVTSLAFLMLVLSSVAYSVLAMLLSSLLLKR